MCHVFLQNKVRMPPPMELLSNSSNGANPKVNSHDDNNEELDCFQFDNVLILICMWIIRRRKSLMLFNVVESNLSTIFNILFQFGSLCNSKRLIAL